MAGPGRTGLADRHDLHRQCADQGHGLRNLWFEGLPAAGRAEHHARPEHVLASQPQHSPDAGVGARPVPPGGGRVRRPAAGTHGTGGERAGPAGPAGALSRGCCTPPTKNRRLAPVFCCPSALRQGSERLLIV
ncbi:protein of unknown function [Cupriavidus taiwanensis]|nr:protein of unknown function [Cupriavidus taiwanensis]